MHRRLHDQGEGGLHPGGSASGGSLHVGGLHSVVVCIRGEGVFTRGGGLLAGVGGGLHPGGSASELGKAGGTHPTGMLPCIKLQLYLINAVIWSVFSVASR